MKKRIEIENSIINLCIDSESELYEKYDDTSETVSSDVISYIENKIENVPIYNTLEIQIKCDEKINIEKFNNAFQKYISNEIEKRNKEIKFNKVRKFLLFIIGIIFIIISFALSSKTDSILTEITSIIGSFAIWEVADLVLLTGNDLKLEKINFKRKAHCKIKQI